MCHQFLLNRSWPAPQSVHASLLFCVLEGVHVLYPLSGTSHQVSNIAFSERGQRGRGALCFQPRYTKVMLCMRRSQPPKSVYASPFSCALQGVHVLQVNAKARPCVTFFLRAIGRLCHLCFQQVVTNAKQRPCVTCFLCALGRPCAISFSIRL